MGSRLTRGSTMGLMSGSQWGVQASFSLSRAHIPPYYIMPEGHVPWQRERAGGSRQQFCTRFSHKHTRAYIYFGANSRGKWVRWARDSPSPPPPLTPPSTEKGEEAVEPLTFQRSTQPESQPARPSSQRTLLIWASAELGHSPDERDENKMASFI